MSKKKQRLYNTAQTSNVNEDWKTYKDYQKETAPQILVIALSRACALESFTSILGPGVRPHLHFL